MKYKSTRNSTVCITEAEAISRGISVEGGLFVPETLPILTGAALRSLADKPYRQRAFDVLKPFFGVFSDDELRGCVNGAYGDNFDVPGTVELSKIDGGTFMLELWHGPTAAFKDMALQILPRFMGLSVAKTGGAGKTLVLVATSGDTGKAALEGFKDVEGFEIAVFYPEDGVSDMQKLQMVTQEGDNVHVFAVKGNFDDCQNGVKDVFADVEAVRKADLAGFRFSSANSINWGRLCPQIVYYVSAYAELMKTGEVSYGEEINVAVPTGNFGNILAAYYAKEMGVPIKKLICASNTNNILSDFINTGVYDRNREFFTTVSPSMDILISSNLERLLYRLSGDSDGIINGWFSALKADGVYSVDENTRDALKSGFYAGWCNEDDTKSAIKKVFYDRDYLMDTHTAVGYKVLEDYRRESGDGAKAVIASTANPYKFGGAVYGALGGKSDRDGFGLIEELQGVTGVVAPKTLTSIKDKPIRFTEVIDKPGIKQAVLNIL